MPPESPVLKPLPRSPISPERQALVLAVGMEVRRRVRRSPSIRRRIGIDCHLGGACAVASLALVRVLRRLGVPCLFVLGHAADGEYWYHCWVDLDGWSVDLTATQFDGHLPKVRILPDDPPEARRGAVGRRAICQVNRAWRNESAAANRSAIEHIVARTVAAFEWAKASAPYERARQVLREAGVLPPRQEVIDAT